MVDKKTGDKLVMKTQRVSLDLSIQAECEWLEALINFRIRELCGDLNGLELPVQPIIETGFNSYFDVVEKFELNTLERIALSLAFIAQTVPQYLDYLYTKNKYTDQIFTEFGVALANGKGLMPTWKTAFFLYAGNDVNAHFLLLKNVYSEAKMYANGLLFFPSESSTNPFLTELQLSPESIHAWAYPAKYKRLADKNFPADRITSPLEWSDLFINDNTAEGLHELKLWLRHEEEMRARPKLAKHLNLGMRVLFYGPSGTGKTLTASLLGKEFDLPVYRVDLSQMVSKWIGETEKNLARVFDVAERENWVLFFDEADALFSKRGSVSSSNDRHANQQVSYLLQRVENYDGTIIMATNLKENIDEAFARRFQLTIEFPMPDAAIRVEMWRQLLEDTFPIEPDVDLERVGTNYELTGGSMKNIFRSLMLRVYDKDTEKRTISMKDLTAVIERELMKTGVYLIQKNY